MERGQSSGDRDVPAKDADYERRRGTGNSRLSFSKPGEKDHRSHRRTLQGMDRPNALGDTFLNVLENPSVGIVFMVPKRREVVRVNGSAALARDPNLLNEMAVNGKTPDLVMIVRVREAFFHCGKAMIRSGLWEPERWGSIDGLPTYAQALKDHAASADTVDTIQARIDQNEAERLY
jgi:hypothetical protein